MDEQRHDQPYGKDKQLGRVPPAMVKIPKLDLTMPPASPRRRGSRAVFDDMYGFMPQTPGPLTPALCDTISTPDSHRPSMLPVSEQPSKSADEASQSDIVKASQSSSTVTQQVMPASAAMAPSPSATMSESTAASSKERQPTYIQPPGQTDLSSNTASNHNLMHSPQISNKLQTSPMSKSSTPRSPHMPLQTPGNELDQVYPRSWAGLPRASITMSEVASHNVAPHPLGFTPASPENLADGQFTPQQLLTRNEVGSIFLHMHACTQSKHCWLESSH